METTTEIPARRGLAAWLALCIVFVVLDVAGVAEGLAFPVPLIVALVLARVLEHAAWARRRPRLVALAVAMACAVLAVAVRVLDLDLLGFGPPDLAATLAVAAALGLLLSSAWVRAAVLPPLGLSPASPVHAVTAAALVIAAASSVMLFVELQDEATASIPFYATDSVVAVSADLALALAGIGFLLTRDFHAALERLDLRRLRWPQVGWAFAAAVLFHALVGVLDWTESIVLPGVHALEDRFAYEFVGIPPLLGAVLVSVAAGVGEEVLFRGALQPRLGIVLSAALFAVLHVQYQVPGILMIFAIGMALGLLKRQTSTTFTVVVHVVYDLGAFLTDIAG